MECVISGRAGVALLINGDELSSLHIGSPETIPRNAGEARFLFNGANDLIFLEDVGGVENAIRTLEAASDGAVILRETLVAIDVRASRERRQAAANNLEELLERNPEAAEFSKRVLFAEQRPATADLAGAKELCQGPGRKWLERLEELAPLVKEVKRAWDSVAGQISDAWGEVAREKADGVFVREGVFSSFVDALSAAENSEKDFAGVIERCLRIPAVQSVPSAKEILLRWQGAVVSARSRRPRQTDEGISLLQPIVAIDAIKRAWEQGRPIVPLFGAGLSIEAGIPGTTVIAEYLAKVRYLSQHATLAEGRHWPEFNEVNQAIIEHNRSTEPNRSDKEVLKKAIEWALTDVLPNSLMARRGGGQLMSQTSEVELYGLFADWRTLLRRLSDGDPAIIDPLLEKLTRGRQPGQSHRFVAFLTQLLGWRLLLTTNFDALLEHALADSGRRARTYALPDHGAFPSPSLIQGVLTLLKLHGGHFNVRFSDVLDTKVDKGGLETFLSYFGHPKEPPVRPLLLVVGYRGADRRVMSLIQRFLKKYGTLAGDEPSLIWVCREQPPNQLLKIAKSLEREKRNGIVSTRFTDVGLFLKELCTRIRSTFPLCSEDYVALTHAPAITHRKKSKSHLLRDQLNKTDASVVVFAAKHLGVGTSTWLTEFTRWHERTHRVIWCDLEEMPSLDALVTHLLGQLQKYDPELTPIVLSQQADDPTLLGVEGADSLHGDHDPRLSRLVQALRRAKYFIGIDSMGEFGRSHIGHDRSEPAHQLEVKYEELSRFLISVARRASELGESRFCFVYSPVITLDSEELNSERDSYSFATERDQQTVLLSSSKPASSNPQLDPTRPFSNLGKGHTGGARPSEHPQQIGHYRVAEYIGSGGFADVYRVDDEVFNRSFAAKVFRSEKGSREAAEAQQAILLNHTNIVRIFHVGMEDERPFLIYEYITGGTLSDLLRDDKRQTELSPRDEQRRIRRRMRIIAQIADALHYAHVEGRMIHCDVKPANVLLTDEGDAKVTDFGLAIQRDVEIKSVNRGTPNYMSPEQFTGDTEKFGPLTDVYSLGVVMYEVLAGERPFSDPDREKLKDKVVSEAPAPLTSKRPTIPESLAYICHKCLEKEPEDRYRSAGELADAVKSWLQSERSERPTTRRHPPTEQRLMQIYHDSFEQLQAAAPQDEATSEDEAASRDEVKSDDDAKQADVAIVYPHEPIGYFRAGETQNILRSVLDIRIDERAVDTICERIVGLGNTVLDAVRLSWNSMRFEHQAILMIAAAFRRPRSIIALRRIGSIALQKKRGYVLQLLKELAREDMDAGRGSLDDVTNDEHVEDVEAFARIDQVLEELEDAGFLIRQEGGSYWMHTSVRDTVYRDCATKEPQGMANLHELIAYYYYELVYRPSRDVQAFYEFVFHQLSAIREAPPDKQVTRLLELASCLNRERSHLLSRAHASTLLNWVVAIRTVEMRWLSDRLRRSMFGGNEEQAAKLDDIKQNLLADLCDLEGAIHRRTTNYREGIRLRCVQVAHRVGEVAQSFAQFKSKVQKKITNALKQNLDARWADEIVGNLNELVDDTERLSARQAFADRLGEYLDNNAPHQLGNELSVWLEVSMEVASYDTASLRRSTRRLVEHLMDIAVCFQGLHWRKDARGLFQEIKSELKRFDELSLESKRPGGVSPREKRPISGLTSWANRVQCQCSARYMDSCNSEVYTWDGADKRHKASLDVLQEYPLAMQALERYSDDARGTYARHKCGLKGLVARAHYLNGRFEQAYLVLESARASVAQETGSNEQMALAVCELQWAECLMLHSDAVLQALDLCSEEHSPEEASSFQQRLEAADGVARNKLQLAQLSINHAREILSQEHSAVWRWTLLYLEQTQLFHEEILLTFVVQMLSESDQEAVRQRLTGLALKSISAGLDNISKDRVRWGQFATLWWQLYVCFIFERELSVQSNWDAWERANQIAGLDWFFEQQASARRSKKDPRSNYDLYAERIHEIRQEVKGKNKHDRQTLLEIQAYVFQREFVASKPDSETTGRKFDFRQQD